MKFCGHTKIYPEMGLIALGLNIISNIDVPHIQMWIWQHMLSASEPIWSNCLCLSEAAPRITVSSRTLPEGRSVPIQYPTYRTDCCVLVTYIWKYHPGFLSLLSLCVCTYTGQLSWLIYLIGSVIGGRVNQYSSTDYDTVDGQLICR